MTPWLDDGDVRLYHGDALEQLAAMPSESVQCVVTSPPFWGLRDYGEAGQIGLEETPDEWCAKLVAVMREARRVLRSDGVCWIEVGDTYAGGGGGNYGNPIAAQHGQHLTNVRNRLAFLERVGCKPKDLVGAPWLLAFALRADGWYLRSDTIWSRPNPMPESVTDRPTKAHSYVFLLTKAARYYYDSDSIREPAANDPKAGGRQAAAARGDNRYASADYLTDQAPDDDRRHKFNGAATLPTANARSVWSIPTEPTPFAHFATFPQALVERCIKSGSAEGDVILDPFVGSGTTCLVARRLGRHAVGIELNHDYLAIAATRLQQLSLLGGTA